MTDHDTTDEAEAAAFARRLFAPDEDARFAALTVATPEPPDPDNNPPTGVFATNEGAS